MLAQELEIKRKSIYESMPQATTEAFDRQIEELRAAHFTEKSIRKGDQAPDFRLKDAGNKEVQLTRLLQKGPVVLSFYRGGWCPYCNLELRALQLALPEIRMSGAELITVTPESSDNSISTIEKNELTFQVLTDPDNLTGKSYGLVFEFPAYLIETYKTFDVDLSSHNNSDRHELPVPATYVIRRDSTVEYAYINEDYTKRADIDEIIECLKRLKTGS